MNRIDATFRQLRKNKRKAFIAFLTAGYPDLDTTAKLILELFARGADIIEIGIPFSDPMADGPVIQESSQEALKRHVNMVDAFNLVRSVRRKAQGPLLFMSYYNPIFNMGEKRFVKEAAAAGLDGIIVPDLPVEEAGPLSSYASAGGIHTIMFVAPTTGHNRLVSIARKAMGFIYYLSVSGVTGARRDLPGDISSHVRDIQRLTSTPVCVGFGVSTRQPGQEYPGSGRRCNCRQCNNQEDKRIPK